MEKESVSSLFLLSHSNFSSFKRRSRDIAMKIRLDNIYLPTGNEQISIPTLHTDGRIENINFISMKHRGLIEIVGEMEHHPLFRPILRVNGNSFNEKLNWERESFWLPKFSAEKENVIWSGEITAPAGERGFYYSFKVRNRGDQNVAIEMGMEGSWAKTLHTINESKEVIATPKAYKSDWNNSIIFELIGETPIFAFAPITDKELDIITWQQDSQHGVISYQLLKNIILQPNEDFTLCFYWGIGLEEVGAATSAKEMLRKGYNTLKQTTLKWLNQRTLTTGDKKLDEVMNLNLFFNFFFATGKTLDTEEDVLVTSRSPRYYVSASYWDRDSLLWSFPSILITDRKRARSMLDYVFTIQKRNIGIHSRYIDGTVLEPGFELDELCAPIVALDRYLAYTDDWDYMKEAHVKKSLQHIVEILEQHRHSQWELYDTFLQPTDDPIVYPYLTYNNVLVWKTFVVLSNFALRENKQDEAQFFKQKADNVKNAIYNHMVVEDRGKKIFVWSADLEGNVNIYDEPPGSLQLFPYYGFCSEEDIIYKNTLEVIRSKETPYAFKGCRFEELGCYHAEHPWVLSIANSFLSGRKEHAKDLVLRTPMDGGIACESIDEHTGIPRTGEHFATCAGFLAYSIYHAYGIEKM